MLRWTREKWSGHRSPMGSTRHLWRLKSCKTSQNYVDDNIRNNKFGCRCRKIGNSGEKVVTEELFIREENRAEKEDTKAVKTK